MTTYSPIKLRWKKGIFSNTNIIYSKDRQIGKLNESSFSRSATGELNGKIYTFKKKGYFRQTSEIIDVSENKVIGEITYNSWMTKATIKIGDKTIHWKYDNSWNTKWSVFNAEGVRIKYAGSSMSGQIDSNIDDPLFLLCGLYVINYYRQISIAIFIALFVPIWMNALT